MVTDAAHSVPDRRYTDLLDQVEFQPVFIMGNARSGTTILYRLLTLSERFNSVTAYHLLRYEELLANQLSGQTERAKAELQEVFCSLGIAGSRFDRVAISPDFPEEYGFGLSDGWSQRLRPESLPRLIELCRKVQYLSHSERPLLLKNPWDYGNFLFVKEAFPASKFIFIHRDPIRIMSSLLRSMRWLLQERNAYHALLAGSYDRLTGSPIRLKLARAAFSQRLGLGVRIVSRQVARAARYFVHNVAQLDSEDYICLRYEDLCRAPAAAVAEILGFLALEQNPKVAYADSIRPSKAPVPDEIRAVQRRLLKRLKLEPYLAYCGYSMDESGEIGVRPRARLHWRRPWIETEPGSMGGDSGAAAKPLADSAAQAPK